MFMRGVAQGPGSTGSSEEVPPQPASKLSDSSDTPTESKTESKPKRKMTMAERDAALMNSWKEHEGSLANAEFEHGQVAEGYRRNVKANIFRKPKYPFYKEGNEAINQATVQGVVVRGFNADAVAAIKTSAGGEDGDTAGVDTVIEEVEDKIMIPRENRANIAKPTEKGPELVLIPEDSIVHYLFTNKLLSARKDKHALALAHAQATFHLLDPTPGPEWDRCPEHRQDAEWTFARMRYREGAGSFVCKVNISSVLVPTRFASLITPSHPPQFNDVTAFTRLWSPSRAALVEVFLHYPAQCNLVLLYRIHDLVPSDALLKKPHIHSIEGRPEPGAHLLDRAGRRAAHEEPARRVPLPRGRAERAGRGRALWRE
ncbi:hypothetical protein OH77DRAFT_1517665 [Trametes cingulata]|nr:hypothetical protein OH77DRAFT_1517665 [Trametes cingulata]